MHSALKTLILIRHAHRNTDEPSRDNGLSEKGREQIKKMTQFALKRLRSKDFQTEDDAELIPLLLTSPKKRCQETIAPLGKELNVNVKIDERLGEHRALESQKEYSTRIDDFITYWKNEAPDLTVICSHGDWIPIAIQKLTGASFEIRKCGWIEVQLSGDDTDLSWIVQKPE